MAPVFVDRGLAEPSAGHANRRGSWARVLSYAVNDGVIENEEYSLVDRDEIKARWEVGH